MAHLPPEEVHSGPKVWALRVVAFFVWIGTAVFGLVDIYLGRQAAVRLHGLFSSDLKLATLLGNIIVVILALLWIAYVIVAGENNLRQAGSGKGWPLFAWALGIELLILFLYLLA